MLTYIHEKAFYENSKQYYDIVIDNKKYTLGLPLGSWHTTYKSLGIS